MSSVQLRSSMSPSPPASVHDLKQRVIACLNRLADRDTLALAAAELDSIACGLSPETFSAFINCLQGTDSSARSPVRKHCVSLLSLLSRSHGDSLAPNLSKMVSTVIRRLRDPDSAVRAACAAAVADMSTSITGPPFSVLSEPMIETLVQDRDPNAQIGAAVCLAAAVDAAVEPDVEQLRKALPKMGRLLQLEGFKAKPELLAAIGSVIGVGGAGSKGMLDWLVPCVSEFLSSEDWHARKAAAEALARVAMAEEELAPHYKKACLAVLENRRFDKVKLVREMMNHTLELWKQVRGDAEEVSESPSLPKSSTDSRGAGPPRQPTKSSSTCVGFKTTQPKKALRAASSSSSETSGEINDPLKSENRNSNTPVSSKLDDRAPVDHTTRKLENDSRKFDQESGERWNYSKPRIKRALFSKTQEVKENRISGSRFGSRIVPCFDEENIDAATISNSAQEKDETQKDIEGLSMIRNQIAQIEKRQSNLFDLLQSFMGSSQSGIHSLESRVQSLETALSKISRDLAVSNGGHTGDTCCAEFLSSKFWRKTESRFPCSVSSPPTHILPSVSDSNNKGTDAKLHNLASFPRNRSSTSPHPLPVHRQ